MNKLNIHLGYIDNGIEKGFKAFDFDLTQFPVLFVNWLDCIRHKNEPIIQNIIKTALMAETKNKRVKVVVIDEQHVKHCHPSISTSMYPKTVLKRVCDLVTKIYKCSFYPNFFPYTKYIIIVNDAWGFEYYLSEIIPKLGQIGVYLIFSGCERVLTNYTDLKKYLYGEIVHVFYDHSYAGVDMLAMPYSPNWGIVMRRFKPEYKCSPAIYTDLFYEIYCNPPKTPIDILCG